MRVLFGFLSLLALGLMAAVAISLAGKGLSPELSGVGARHAGSFHLDYSSLMLGLALGIVIATLARLSWAEMPRRLALWLMANERNFYRGAMAAIFLAVLMFY